MPRQDWTAVDAHVLPTMRQLEVTIAPAAAEAPAGVDRQLRGLVSPYCSYRQCEHGKERAGRAMAYARLFPIATTAAPMDFEPAALEEHVLVASTHLAIYKKMSKEERHALFRAIRLPCS